MVFDEYVGVDWSGAKYPVRSHSISLASCSSNNNCAPRAKSQPLSRTDVFNYISNKIESNGRTFIGIDCNLGYCEDVIKKQFGEQATFQTLWNNVESVNKDLPNFFAGNFWAHSIYGKAFWVSGKKPKWFSYERLKRQTELRTQELEFGVPESPFKLIGAKQVGKGGLSGMRMMHKLSAKYSDKLAIWPFETKHIKSASVVVSEIYPRLFIKKAGFGNKKIRTNKSLNHILSFYTSEHYNDEIINDHMTDAIISAAGMRSHFQSAEMLNLDLPKKAQNTEGWIFGVTP